MPVLRPGPANRFSSVGARAALRGRVSATLTRRTAVAQTVLVILGTWGVVIKSAMTYFGK